MEFVSQKTYIYILIIDSLVKKHPNAQIETYSSPFLLEFL